MSKTSLELSFCHETFIRKTSSTELSDPNKMLTDPTGNYELLDDDIFHGLLKLANLVNSKVLQVTTLRQLLNFI